MLYNIRNIFSCIKFGSENMVNSIKSKNQISIDNYTFLKPVKFVECPIHANNSVKLVNSQDDIIIFASMFERDGNYCKESYDLISKNAKKNSDSKLLSKKSFIKHNTRIYNIFIKKAKHYESVYLVFKENRTFRFTFIINKRIDNTINIFEKILKTIKTNT